jgi:hypothetical protein
MRWLGTPPLEMPLVLVVDDRDGRVISELESPEEALKLLEAMARDDPETPEYLCIVALDDRPGPFVGTESSVTIRPLQR